MKNQSLVPSIFRHHLHGEVGAEGAETVPLTNCIDLRHEQGFEGWLALDATHPDGWWLPLGRMGLGCGVKWCDQGCFRRVPNVQMITIIVVEEHACQSTVHLSLLGHPIPYAQVRHLALITCIELCCW